MLLPVLAGALALLTAASTAHAQRFEYFYGGPQRDAGRGGVQPVSSGGYIAVGETFSTPTPDIYVVRTNDRGARVWEATYEIGGTDSATDIVECANGDFAITGVTWNMNAHCMPSRDMFILRIDRCGVVLNTKTFGSDSSDEIGWDILETVTGDPTEGTNPWDLVVAGSYVKPGRRSDAWLVRVDAQLNLEWSQHYDVNLANNDDYFYACHEALATPPSREGVISHDIIAAGGTSDNFWMNGYEGLIVRVDGATGICGAVGNLGAGVMGGINTEEFHSVIELAEDTNSQAGTIVAVGQTFSNSLSSEIYIAKTQARPWLLINDRTLGDNGLQRDEGYYVREIRNTDSGLTRGNLMVTGYVTTAQQTGRYNNKELFLQEYTGLLVPVAPTTRIFGGLGDDWGWSCHPVARQGNFRTAGFVACGFSTSKLSGALMDPQNLYLIKTNNVRNSNCNDSNWEKQDRIPRYPDRGPSVGSDSLNDTCEPTAIRTCRTWAALLCVAADGTMLRVIPACPMPNCNDTIPRDTIIIPPDTTHHDTTHHDTIIVPPPPPPPPPPHDSSMVFKAAPGTGGSAEERNIIVYPNPVYRGESFAVDMINTKESHIVLSVVALDGSEVLRAEGNYRPGKRLFPLDTKDWPVGTYLINVTTVEGTSSTRIVVVDQK